MQLAALREVLAAIIAILHAHFPEAELLKFNDWHEHDGFVNQSNSSSWDEVRALLSSDEALIVGAFTNETYVRKAFYFSGCEFLLRIYIPDDWPNSYDRRNDPELLQFGLFDLTCSAVLAKE